MSRESNALKFQCPEGYSEENIVPQLFYEDIDEDSELWLVRMPHDLDCSVVENQKMILDENSHHIKHNDCPYEYVSNAQEISKLSIILPRKSDGSLISINKVVKGSIFISNDIVIKNVSSIKMEEDEDPIFDTLNNVSLNDNVSASVESNCFAMNSSQLQDSSLNLSAERKKSKSKKKKHSLIDNIKTEKTSDNNDFPNCYSQK